MDTPGVKTGRQKSIFSPTENRYSLVQVKPQDVSFTKTTDLPCFLFRAAVYIRLKSFFFLLFFAKYIIVRRLFRNIHPSLQYSSHSRIHTPLYDVFLTCTCRTMPLPLCYSVHNFFFFFFFLAFHNNY